VNKEIPILIIDDEEIVRSMLATFIGTKYPCRTAASAQEALQIISTSPVNLVLSDIHLGIDSGIELCKTIREISPDTAVVMMSGMVDIEYAIQAMQHGAFDFITKPFDLSEFMLLIERALRYQALVAAKRNYAQSLEATVRERTAELRGLNENLNQMLETLYANYRATLRALAKALEARHCERLGHSDRVVAYSLRLAREMGMTQNELIGLEQGALLHDIGKISIRDSILLKTGPLTEQEREEMRQHIAFGLQIISRLNFLSGARPVVSQHHEKFDGSGYPGRLRGEMIHINARIFAVADAFDAITSDRTYRAAASYVTARAEIIANSGSHFDPKVVEAFLRIPESEFAEIGRIAQSEDYLEQIIDKREIRTFIVSMKQHAGTTGPLKLPLHNAHR
jgi:putative nucleotidyltransferase with HDIG domain